MPNCTHPACNREAQFLSPPKCYFHVDKKAWFTATELGERKWNEKQVTAFWKEIRSAKTSRGDFDFSGIIFPEFELLNSDNIESHGTLPERPCKIKRDWNFFVASSDILFPSEASFKGAIFEGRCEFISIVCNDTIDFSRTVFRDATKFNGSYFKRGIFEKAIFEGEVDFNYAVFADGASFANATFGQRCYLEHVTFANGRGDTTFRATVFKDIVSFNDSMFHNETYFSGTEFHNIAVFYASKGDTLIFDFIKLGTLSLLDFSKVILRTLKMSTVQNLSATIRFSATILDCLVLKNTALGKSELNDFDVSTCKEITIAATSFFGTLFNNVSWGKITVNRFNASRDVYRQLKYVLEQQGNFIEANRFYSLEMKEYKRELSGKSLSFDTWQDKIIFFLHEKVSNFSQSWFLPMLWFFVIGMVLTLYKAVQSQAIIPYEGWQLIGPTLLFVSWIIGRGAVDLNEKLRSYQFDIILPGLIFILLFLICVPNALNEFAQVVNPFGVLKENDGYRGIEFAWFLHKAIMTFIVYQFVVTLRMQTRRK